MRQSALTLVELIVALAVTTIVTGATVPILRGVSAARQRVDAQMTLQQEARAAVRVIATALQNACRSDDQVLEGTDGWQGDLPSDRIRFFSISRRPVRLGEPESDLRECEFFLSQPAEDQLPVLASRIDPTRNELPDGGGVIQRVAGNVIALDFAYLDGGVWQDNWPLSLQRWPAAIRIRLSLASDAKLDRTWAVSRIVNFPYLPAVPPATTPSESSQGQGQSPTQTPAVPAALPAGGTAQGGPER